MFILTEQNRSFTIQDLPFPEFEDPEFLASISTIQDPPPKSYKPSPLPDIDQYLPMYLVDTPPQPKQKPVVINAPFERPYPVVTDPTDDYYVYLPENVFLDRRCQNARAYFNQERIPYPDLHLPEYRAKLLIIIPRKDKEDHIYPPPRPKPPPQPEPEPQPEPQPETQPETTSEPQPQPPNVPPESQPESLPPPPSVPADQTSTQPVPSPKDPPTPPSQLPAPTPQPIQPSFSPTPFHGPLPADKVPILWSTYTSIMDANKLALKQNKQPPHPEFLKEDFRRRLYYLFDPTDPSIPSDPFNPPTSSEPPSQSISSQPTQSSSTLQYIYGPALSPNPIPILYDSYKRMKLANRLAQKQNKEIPHPELLDPDYFQRLQFMFTAEQVTRLSSPHSPTPGLTLYAQTYLRKPKPPK